jgi:hypothetical protein
LRASISKLGKERELERDKAILLARISELERQLDQERLSGSNDKTMIALLTGALKKEMACYEAIH